MKNAKIKCYHCAEEREIPADYLFKKLACTCGKVLYEPLENGSRVGGLENYHLEIPCPGGCGDVIPVHFHPRAKCICDKCGWLFYSDIFSKSAIVRKYTGDCTYCDKKINVLSARSNLLNCGEVECPHCRKIYWGLEVSPVVEKSTIVERM